MRTRKQFAASLLGTAIFFASSGAVGAATAPPVLAAPAQASAPSAEADKPWTPAVRMVLVEALSSRTARTGQHFALTVSDDVILDGAVLIPKGATASGTVLFARKKGSGGRSGALDLRVDSVDTPSGPIRLKSSDSRRGQYKGGKAVAVGMLFGIVGSLVYQGDEINLSPGQEFLAELAPNPGPTAPPSAAPVAASPEHATAAPATPASVSAAIPTSNDSATSNPQEH